MRSLLRIAVLCLLIATTIPAQALDTATRAVGPVIHWDAPALVDFDPSWLHLKLVEGSGARLEAGRLVSDRAQLEALNSLLEDAITLRRTLPGDIDCHPMFDRISRDLFEYDVHLIQFDDQNISSSVCSLGYNRSDHATIDRTYHRDRKRGMVTYECGH